MHYHRHWRYLVVSLGNQQHIQSMGFHRGQHYWRGGTALGLRLRSWYLLLTFCPKGDGNS